MKKLIAFLLLLIIAATLLCGCGKSEEHSDRFITVDRETYFEIVVDTETGIEYFRQYTGGICPLIDSYGNPYIYPAFDAREDRP